MPKGKPNGIEVLNGWPMKKKKELKEGEDIFYCIHRTRQLGCHASYRKNRFNGKVTVMRDHSRHRQDDLETQAELARSDMREYAKASTESPSSQINRIRNKYATEAVMQVGDFNSLRKVIGRAKVKNPEQKKVDDNCEIVGTYTQTSDGKQFLITETTLNGKNLLIFASEVGLKLLSESNVVFCDGTFDCTPPNFCQLFSIHCYLSDSVVRPVVFALLPSKELEAYKTVLRELKNQPQLKYWTPGIVIADFERNIKTAFVSEFPGVEMHNCYFHLMQSWVRKATNLKIYEETFNGNSLYEFWKLLKALPFVEEHDIPRYFSELEASLPIGHVAKEFIAYLEKYYVLGTSSGPPLYPPKDWSCALVSKSSIHRTTNSLEVWHKSLSSVIYLSNGLRQIRLSDLIEKIKIEDIHTTLDSQMLAINRTHQVTASRRTSHVLKDNRLRKVLENKPTSNSPLDGIEFLKAISLALKT